MVIENGKRSYVDTIVDYVKKEDYKPLKEDIQKLVMKKNQEYDRAWKLSSGINRPHSEYFRRSAPTKRPPIPMHHFFFLTCVTLVIIMGIRL